MPTDKMNEVKIRLSLRLVNFKMVLLSIRCLLVVDLV